MSTKKKLKFQSLYSHHRGRSAEFATNNNEESMTQQSDLQSTDINIIMKQHSGQSMLLPNVTQTPLYGDFTNAMDYRTMVETIQAADAAFMQIPAEARRRFGNDPAEFIKFAQDKENLPELRKMGLAPPEQKKQEPEPMAVRIVNPEPPKEPPK